MMHDDDQELRLARKPWISASTAAVGYGMTLILLGMAAVGLISDIGEPTHSGDAVAGGLFVTWVLFPITLVSVIFASKLTAPRLLKALIPIVVLVVCALVEAR